MGCIVLCLSVILPTVFAPKLAGQNSTAVSSKPEESVGGLTSPADSVSTDSAVKSVIVSNTKLPVTFQKLQDKYHLVAIPTYDGSDQLTHPKVLYFPKGWKGYRYWMSMTPYPYEHDMFENPSIVVSNDGKTWGTPQGLTNPVSGIPSDVALGGHYSDPQLVMRGDTMELWYRYNPALITKQSKQPVVNPTQINNPSKQPVSKKIWRRANNSINIYYRKTTKDGVHWSAAQKLLQGKDGYLSMCVNYENGKYKIWYATYGGDLFSSESKDALNWSVPVHCTVPLPKGDESYHQDIIKYGSEYYLLQTAEKMANYTFQLFLLKSQDGIHFTQIQQVLPSNDKNLWKDISFYRSTLFVKENKLEMYISMIIPHLKWYITHITLPLPSSGTGAKANKSVKI